MIRTAFAAVLLAASAAQGIAHGEDRQEEDAGREHAQGEESGSDLDEHVSETGGLRALHAWTRATREGEALVFVELSNRGPETVALIGAASPQAERGELVGFRMEDGAPAYVPIPRLPLEAGHEIALAPFGLAIRLKGLSRPLVEGEVLEAALLTEAGALPLAAQVEPEDAARHSHAGHAHD